MSVYFCIPSARPRLEANQCLAKWRARGYKIALWRDSDGDVPICDLLLTGAYPGYANAVNALVREVLKIDPDCSWVVIGGDDMEPDPNRTPEEIAGQCASHFATKGNPTYGVMQPTGDRWGDTQGGAYADRVAGSAWIGRRFCETVYGGHGPLWFEYFHMGVDEELQAIAKRLGVFWQRPDLLHLHNHWARSAFNRATMPAFLSKANSPHEWNKYKEIFRLREAAGFPGHEAL